MEESVLAIDRNELGFLYDAQTLREWSVKSEQIMNISELAV